MSNTDTSVRARIDAATSKAVAVLEADKGKKSASVDDFMADLHAND